MEGKMRYQRIQKVALPMLQFDSMDYSQDFSDPIKSRSLSTSTPLASKSLSPSVFSPGNDSGYPDSIAESTDDTAFFDNTVTTNCSTNVGHFEKIVHDSKKRSDLCENENCECSLLNDWEIPEEEDVSEKKKPKRLSDFPRYSLEFESCDLDSSFGASGLADKLDSVAIHDVVQHFSPSEPDRLIGRKIGLEKVDILSEMNARNIQGVSLVLSYLGPKDLCRMRHVSHHWKMMCDSDSKARTKCHKYLKSLKTRASSLGKENVLKSSKRQHRGLTTGDVLTTVQSTHMPRSPKKNPVVNLFVQAVSSLQSHESLRHCPKCNSAAKTFSVQDRAICMNEKCKFDFCVKCFCEDHGARNCIPVATKKSKIDSVGSKKSKKNLRRL